MNSPQHFSLKSQPNDQRKPPKAPPRKREPKESKELAKKAAFFARCVEPVTHHECVFRHSHWQAKRDQVRQALISVGINTFALDTWDNCGSACAVQWSETAQKHRLSANYCHNRHCEPCMRAKGNRLAANLKSKLRTQPDGRYRFITLTLKHSAKPLHQQLKRLYACFKALRKTKLWKNSQRGGAVTVEVKWQANTRRWHPHLHIIAEGAFLNQADLAQAWEKATGDSRIVDIRALKSGDDAAHYVSKYVAKGTSNNVWKDTSASQEWILATKGLRTCATFGTWRGYRLLKTETPVKDWQTLGSLNDLINRARSGEAHAINLLAILRPPGDHDHPARPTPPLPNTDGIFSSS